MAPGRGAALTVPNQNTSLQSLLEVAREVLGQTARGLDPALSSSALATAARAATTLTSELTRQTPHLHEFAALWSCPGQDAASYLALFSLALRRSGPSLTKDSERDYDCILDNLSWQLGKVCFLTEPVPWGHIGPDLVAPALLRAGTLECFSRLLADTAEKLKPAAATAALAEHSLRKASSAAEVSGADAVAAAAGGRTGSHQHGKEPRQPQNSQASQPTDGEGLQLVNTTHILVSGLISGVFQSPDGGGGGCRSTGGNSSGGGGSEASGGGGSRSSGGPDGGGGGNAAPAPTKHHLTMHGLRAQLQSSWVMEHWAQVLLLSTDVASARGCGEERIISHAAQARLLNWLCAALGAAGFRFSDVLRRPCGCTLAAAHMAQLCAALDGGDAFGAAKPGVLVMTAWESRDFRYLARTDSKAQKYDDVAMRLRRAVNLHAAIATVAAWVMLLLASKPLQESPCTAAFTRGDGACPAEAEAMSAGQGGAGASQGVVSEGQEENGGGGSDERLAPEERRTAAHTYLRKLPPFNRAATVHLCLRLAKGVLACWGRPLSGVRLELPSRNPSAPAPLLPKEQSCALLHRALACARLALLPAAWGRERVPRRTRAQLRAWWETYVAAAQHPEALAVGEPDVLEYPQWMLRQPVFGAAPADATAAIEAGLLPCLTRLVDRMGTGCTSGTVWCPPNIFPGVGPCLDHVLQFGPLGQVGELASALGRRLRGAVEELRAAVALEGAGAGRRGGERTLWLADVARQAMLYTDACLSVLFLRWLNVHAGGAAAGSAGPGTSPLTQRPGSSAPAAAEAAQFPVRSSFALAELLPALSVGVRLCGELVASVAGGEGWARERGGGGAGDTAAERRHFMGFMEVLGCGCSAAASALDCATTLLATLCREAAAGPLGGRAGGSAAPGAAGSSGGGGSPSCGDAAWRQLLLRDVQLMELLGAGVALHGELSRAAAAGLLPSNLNHRPDLSSLCTRLSSILPLAALTSPAEFRAAVDGGAGPAGAEAAEAGRGAGPSPRPCMPLAAVQAVLELEAAHGVIGPGQAGDEGLKVVARVLGGWDPAAGEAWDLARGCCMLYGLDLAEVVEVVRGMPQPEEARAEVAAAAAAAAGASGPGPA